MMKTQPNSQDAGFGIHVAPAKDEHFPSPLASSSALRDCDCLVHARG
jgi:hypothetical protein